MSSKLPILLALAGVAYFIFSASAEPTDNVGCMDEAACNYDATATVDSGDCKYGDSCDDDDIYTPPGDPCDNIDTSQKSRTVFSNLMLFDNERSGSDAPVWGQEKCSISGITVNQKDYVPGSQVIIGFDAQVKNKSESRCGDTAFCWNGCVCTFAPTNGEIVGANEGKLEFEVSILPHGSTVAANSQTFAGSSRFTVYSNESEFNRDELLDEGYGEVSNLSWLKDAWATYETSITIPANVSALGNYDIIIRSGLQSDWNSRKFRGIIVAPNAFNVEDCDNTSGAENYETRFMSNQSFMTL